MSFSTNLGVISLPTEEGMTRGDNLGPNLEPKQEPTGKLFTEVASSRETLNVTKLDKVVKKEKPWQNMPICAVLKERNK